MLALRIGLLAVDGVTLAEVAPARERLETMGAQVTVLVPSGGSILPITGRYFPAAGGQARRCALSQVTQEEFDLLLLPSGISLETLTRYPQILTFLRGQLEEGSASPLPVFGISYLQHLLNRGATLAGLARNCGAVLSGGPPRR